MNHITKKQLLEIISNLPDDTFFLTVDSKGNDQPIVEVGDLQDNGVTKTVTFYTEV